VANVEKRYSIQVAAYNLDLVLRHLFGVGTPRQAMAAFWLVIDKPQSWGLSIIAIVEPPSADQGAIAAASPVVLICLLTFSI
jgi:transposase